MSGDAQSEGDRKKSRWKEGFWLMTNRQVELASPMVACTKPWANRLLKLPDEQTSLVDGG